MWENVDVARVVPWTATSRDVSHNVTLLITGPQSQNIRHAATAVFLGGKLRNRIKVILFIALHSPWSPGIGLGWQTLLGWCIDMTYIACICMHACFPAYQDACLHT